MIAVLLNLIQEFSIYAFALIPSTDMNSLLFWWFLIILLSPLLLTEFFQILRGTFLSVSLGNQNESSSDFYYFSMMFKKLYKKFSKSALWTNFSSLTFHFYPSVFCHSLFASFKNGNFVVAQVTVKIEFAPWPARSNLTLEAWSRLLSWPSITWLRPLSQGWKNSRNLSSSFCFLWL